MSVFARTTREYARRWQAGRQMTKTSIARDLIVQGHTNEFIQRVILAVFGEYWENRSINRVRKIVETNFSPNG